MKLTAALAVALLAVPVQGRSQTADTALEMQSWCRPFATTRVLADGMIEIPQDPNSQFCWGAFAAIQQLSATTEGGRTILKSCPPPDSTRLQMIKIFLHYTDEHPEMANVPFANVAMSALWQAFPCRST